MCVCVCVGVYNLLLFYEGSSEMSFNTYTPFIQSGYD